MFPSTLALAAFGYARPLGGALLEAAPAGDWMVSGEVDRAAGSIPWASISKGPIVVADGRLPH